VHGYLHTGAEGGWLPPGQAADVLRGYGISLAEDGPAGDERAAGAHTAEVTVRVVHDQVFGPLVMLASPGSSKHSAGLAPLTCTDADKSLIDYRDLPAAELTRLRDLLLRVSQLAQDLPEITCLDLTSARIKVAPYKTHDPFLRKLRLAALLRLAFGDKDVRGRITTGRSE
jgi:hypothetical protein